jgi:hypothetical protein
MSDCRNNNSLDTLDYEESCDQIDNYFEPTIDEDLHHDLHNELIDIQSECLNGVDKNIIIYAHRTFFLSDGGIVVQYYLASILDSMGINVKICNVYDNNAENELFNKFITIDEINNNVDFENTIVIYCEGVVGNPLKAKYVVRWMLSKFGQNSPYNYINNWNDNELVYFFNSEIDFIDDDSFDIKYLTLFYINPNFKNNNLDRSGVCFTRRKNRLFHYDYMEVHDSNSFEITKKHSQNDYIDIFNKHEMFISYDPLTFLSIIAIKCGCISIIYPVKGVSKKDYFKMTALYEYMLDKNIESIYGIAYGFGDDEINYAKNTLHLFEEQLLDVNKWFIEKYVNNFVNDINNWENCNNILSYYKNYFIRSTMKNNVFNNFDIDFYRSYYTDLALMNIFDLFDHYNKWGKNVGRVTSQKELDELIASTGQPDFDVEFYKTYYNDLSKFHVRKLVDHYNKWGKNEGRITSQKELDALIASTGQPDFDVEFYRTYYNDLSKFQVRKLVDHYNKWGKNEARITSQKQLNELIASTGQPDFDVEFYRTYYNDLSKFQVRKLVDHYNQLGKNEGHITSQKQLDALIASTGEPDFDVEFYRTYYNDLSKLINLNFFKHYNTMGKNEGRVTSQKQLNALIDSTGQPDFDVEFYRTYYNDLSKFHVRKLVEHYNKWGRNEGRVTSQKRLDALIASTRQPDFDVEFYRTYYNDLSKFHVCKLVEHYNKWGKNEGRVTSQKQLDALIASTGQPGFDVEFYKFYHKDLSKFDVRKLVQHYNEWGKNEGRFFCEKQLNQQQWHELIDSINQPEFDIDFYRTYYKDLSHMTLFQSINHYNTIGRNEGRVASQKQLNELVVSIGNDNPNFDPEFYLTFNKGLHVIENFEIVNENYFKYDFTVGEDYNYAIIKVDTKLIKDHYYYRKIDNFADLLEYNKKNIKKYYFFNKESFYRYYDDFDYDYYKNRYFKDNNEITENDVLFYYHSKGKYERHFTNNKIKLIIYIPPWDIKCGGITVIHYFVYLINTFYNEKFYAKLFMHNNIRYKNPFCNDFAQIDEINDNTVVIYPEIVSGNPLNAKNVVRWIHLKLGIEMPINHYNKWSMNDLVYYWESKEKTDNDLIYKQLTCPLLLNLFDNNNNMEREGSCYLIKKGTLIHKNIQQIHPDNSLCIDNSSLKEINQIFNKYKYFYSYDPNSAYTIYAAICGCIPIIYPIEGISEEEYFSSRIYNFNGTIYNKGIVYGYDYNKINNILNNKINENNKEYYKELFDLYQIKTISKFLEEMYLYIDKNFQLNNTVKEIFFSDI